jgi:hypothetical protein
MKSRSPWRILSSTIAGIALLGGSLAVGAPAALAADPPIGGCSISGNNPGPVGVTQTLNVQDCQNYGQVGIGYNGNPPSQFINIFQGAFGTNAQATWTPLVAGTANLYLGGAIYSTSQITKVATTTTVSAPNNAQIGVATKITVTVQSASPSAYNPTGQVVVKDINGATLSTMGLTAGPGTGQSFAYYWWTPTTAGSFTFQATYAADANDQGSVSPQDVVIATPSGSPIALTHPAQMTQGVPVTLTATVFPKSIQGSVGFTLNGNPISAAIPLINGVANYTWTPNVVGQVTLGASYTTNQGGSGSTTDNVNIIAGPVSADAITLVQPGWGAWNNGGSYNMGNGSNFTFQASTLSGAAVTLSETGPCVVSGLTLQVNNGSGVCNMKATSPGGNGYAGVTYNYTINLVPGVQTATLSAPVSGRYKVGRVLVLESPSQQDTNAGQNINWKIKKGGKGVCQLLYPNDGSVTLKIKKKGTCTALGTAPGVSGQWLKFSTARIYTGR